MLISSQKGTNYTTKMFLFEMSFRIIFIFYFHISLLKNITIKILIILNFWYWIQRILGFKILCLKMTLTVLSGEDTCTVHFGVACAPWPLYIYRCSVKGFIMSMHSKTKWILNVFPIFLSKSWWGSPFFYICQIMHFLSLF